MLTIQRDTLGQPYIQWQQAEGGFKRAWIQIRSGEGDWAGTSRYLNVARTPDARGGPGGNATDFPIWSTLPDEEILLAFVHAICALTGCTLHL